MVGLNNQYPIFIIIVTYILKKLTMIEGVTIWIRWLLISILSLIEDVLILWAVEVVLTMKTDDDKYEDDVDIEKDEEDAEEDVPVDSVFIWVGINTIGLRGDGNHNALIWEGSSVNEYCKMDLQRSLAEVKGMCWCSWRSHHLNLLGY